MVGQVVVNFFFYVQGKIVNEDGSEEAVFVGVSEAARAGPDSIAKGDWGFFRAHENDSNKFNFLLEKVVGHVLVDEMVLDDVQYDVSFCRSRAESKC